MAEKTQVCVVEPHVGSEHWNAKMLPQSRFSWKGKATLNTAGSTERFKPRRRYLWGCIAITTKEFGLNFKPEDHKKVENQIDEIFIKRDSLIE